ncbi:hypothetical protein [Streptomyces aureus]|uniref:hypothetical protein n=1 Tax=Streptomyces aureus TaxID=193461 RepID=UPI00068B3EDE|nr:hypothetical protein [Streptomyces aureus]
MTDPEPDHDRTPDGEGVTPLFREEVWQKFLTDSEEAIQAHAPREPSAFERTGPRLHASPDTSDAFWRGTEEDNPHEAVRSGPQRYQDAVGELWQPEDTWTGPVWGDMDARAKRRRVGLVLGSAVAIVVLLGSASRLSTMAGRTSGNPGDISSQQSEDIPDDLSTTFSVNPASADPSPPVTGGE